MNIILTVRGTDARGYVRGITFSERRALLAQESGKPSERVMWPVQVMTDDAYRPCRKPSDGKSCRKCVTCKARTKAHSDAVQAAEALCDLLARGMNAGHSLIVNVEAGATMPGTGGRFSNIVAPRLLADVCSDPEVKVNVEAGADDPGLWVPED